MPIKITPAQNRRLHQLLNQTEMMDEKRSILNHFTHGRTDSAKALSFQEANAIIQYLEGIQKTDDPSDRMRKKVLAICYNMGWIFGNSPEDQKMNKAKINAFLKRYGYLKKPLNAYTRLELPKLVTQFETIEKKYEAAKINNVVDALLEELNLTLQPEMKRSP